MNQIDYNDLKYAKERGFNPIGWVPCPRGEQGKINPQVTQMFDGEKFFSVFHVKPVYYETLTGDWRPLSEVTSHHGNHRIVFTLDGFRKVHPRYVDWLSKRMDLIGGQLLVGSVVVSPYIQYIHDTVTIPKIGLTTTTVYPDPHTETTTCDGVAYYTNANYATCQSAATGNVGNAAGSAIYANNNKAGANYTIQRGFMLFDTSSIDDGDTIDSGTFTATRLADQQNANGWNNNIVASTPASNTDIVAADYDQVGTTLLSDTTYNNAGWTAGSHDFALNATGVSAVSKTGVTKLGFRLDKDISATAPTGENYCSFYSSETTGTASDPKLVVIHSVASTFKPKVMMVA